MSLADTAAVADLGVFKHGNAVEGIFLAGNNLEAVNRAFLRADTAAVAELGINNGLLPLLLGDELAGLAVFVENALVFADMGASSAVDAAVGVYLVLFLHFAGDSHDGADLRAVVTALASIGNFISHK